MVYPVFAGAGDDVSWDLKLATRAGEDAIRDVFIFVEDTCDLVIEARESDSLCAADRTAKALAEQRTARGGRRVYDKPDSASSLRVPAAKLDQFVDLVGELVTLQARRDRRLNKSCWLKPRTADSGW
jgi:two-component system chemotaxis sensor kinase CheA